MISYIDSVLNKITMYRLVLYYVVLLLVSAFILGFFGVVPVNPLHLLFSVWVILGVSLITNFLFVSVFRAHANIESVYITAGIMALIITPVAPTDMAGVGFLVMVSIWAMASKFIFAIGKKHIFNPVAIAVVLGAVLLHQPATWWVGGNVALLPIVLLGGILIVRKIRRTEMVFTFLLVGFATVALTSPAGSQWSSLGQTFTTSAIFFLAFAMLTEPLTTPPTTGLQMIYGAIVGFLFAPAIHIGSFYFTPELGLLVGNVFAYVVSPKGRHMLTLVRIEEKARQVYNFVFTPDRSFSFRPGQYLEWTLGHRHPDSRGNRRYFTIASAPSDKEIHLGVKFYEPPSTFKKTLASMKVGDSIAASHLAGSFTLPKNTHKKLVFIAGGIGVTPFRSMVQEMLHTQQKRDVVMFYANNTYEDIAYKELFDRAEKELGIKMIHILSKEERQFPNIVYGMLDAALIEKEVPDFKQRVFYISGPPGMVNAFKKVLTQMGVPRRNIKSDFFPGFA